MRLLLETHLDPAIGAELAKIARALAAIWQRRGEEEWKGQVVYLTAE